MTQSYWQCKFFFWFDFTSDWFEFTLYDFLLYNFLISEKKASVYKFFLLLLRHL